MEFLIDEVSSKVRTGPPLDDENDYGFPVWADALPSELRVLRPIADEQLLEGVALPNMCDASTPESAGDRLIRPIPNQLGFIQA